jgi:predicted dehydrogenase
MTSRRTFLAVAGAQAVRTSPSDQIRLGLIGAGGRAHDLFGDIGKADQNATIAGVCDVWRVNRESMVSDVTRVFGGVPKQTTRYEEMLGWKDIDAVLIATPDFTHPRILMDAVAAGKDVYVEKPFAVDFNDGKAAYLAVKKSDRVVQVGTQRRSDPGLIGVNEAIRGGAIGKVTRVSMEVNFQEKRWGRDFSMVKKEDIDWDAYSLHNRLKPPFDARKYRQWQLFRETTSGIPGLWMCHFIDLANWFLAQDYPVSAVSAGGVYLWKDGRQTSDVFQALVEYPDCLVTFAMSLTNSVGNRNLWLGTKGTINADTLEISGEGSNMPDKVPSSRMVDKVPVDSHMANFLSCIRTRKTPRASVQAGFSHAVAGCMAAEALAKGRRITFDAARLEML